MTSAATTITMPQLGETVTEGTITRWLKRVGEPIAKYEAFAEVATDKVNAEIPSPVGGVLLEILVAEGETVPTGAPIARIGDPAGATVAPTAPASDAPAPAPAVAPIPAPPAPVTAPAPSAAETNFARALRLSPAVRRELRKSGLDPATIVGTGEHARVTLRDVQKAATRPRGERGVKLLPLSRARKTIAEHMTHAVRTIPHAWTMIEADVTNLVARRHAERRAKQDALGFAPTYFHYFAHAVVATLAEHPLMNSRYTDAGIETYAHVDLAFAIALPENLIVPVVRDAHRMSFDELATAIADVTERARKGKLAIDELHGGTITINNTGANGSILSTPIINSGQAAIVTMESIVKRPTVVHQDAVAVRSIMNVCCSIDHRAIDGDVVGAFLRHVKLRLQDLDAHS